jgi:trans-aconitate methyltransferase
MTPQTWKAVWEARQLDASRPNPLAQLLAADGMDTGFGSVGEQAWRRYVVETARTIGIEPGCSVFEVGCGAGAWLYELDRIGCQVAGLDGSAALIGYARQHLPRGQWTVGDAADLDPRPRYDFVVSSGVFLYFPSLDYARTVLERMVQKASMGLLVLDVPDRACRDAALAERMRIAGDDYGQRYDGLDHLYYERSWFQDALASLGIRRTVVGDQSIEGYINGQYRFNIFAWLG